MTRRGWQTRRRVHSPGRRHNLRQRLPRPWLRDTGLALNTYGFIAVKDTLQSTNDKNIFACGDVASMINHPRPKAGVFAVRQGPPLALNLRHVLLGEKLEDYVPQTNFLGKNF